MPREYTANERCDMAIAILQATRDGDDLEPRHLKLVEMAVNGHLNETGVQAFVELHKSATEGTYVTPWFHGIEHLTRDHQGYVRWKGRQVEHYDGRFAYSEDGKRQAEEVARRCRLLEARGEIPTTGNVIWYWRDDAPAGGAS